MRIDLEHLVKELTDAGFTVPEPRQVEVSWYRVYGFSGGYFSTFMENNHKYATAIVLYTKDGRHIACNKSKWWFDYDVISSCPKPSDFYAEPAHHCNYDGRQFFIGIRTVIWEGGWLLYKGEQGVYMSLIPGYTPQFRFGTKEKQIFVYSPMTYWGIPEVAYRVTRVFETWVRREERECQMFMVEFPSDIAAVIVRNSYIVGRREEMEKSWNLYEAAQYMFSEDTNIHSYSGYPRTARTFEIQADAEHRAQCAHIYMTLEPEVESMVSLPDEQLVFGAVFVPYEEHHYTMEFAEQFVNNQVFVKANSVYFLTASYVDIGGVAIASPYLYIRQYKDDRQLTYEQILSYYGKVFEDTRYHDIADPYDTRLHLVPLFQGVVFAHKASIATELMYKHAIKEYGNWWHSGWLTDSWRMAGL